MLRALERIDTEVIDADHDTSGSDKLEGNRYLRVESYFRYVHCLRLHINSQSKLKIATIFGRISSRPIPYVIKSFLSVMLSTRIAKFFSKFLWANLTSIVANPQQWRIRPSR